MAEVDHEIAMHDPGPGDEVLPVTHGGLQGVIVHADDVLIVGKIHDHVLAAREVEPVSPRSAHKAV